MNLALKFTENTLQFSVDGVLGSFVFSVASGVFTLTIGRALIGIGFSGGLMVGIIALIIWFPKKHISLVNGLFVGIGSLGGVFATVPRIF